jgi:hypothetical protein
MILLLFFMFKDGRVDFFSLFEDGRAGSIWARATSRALMVIERKV